MCASTVHQPTAFRPLARSLCSVYVKNNRFPKKMKFIPCKYFIILQMVFYPRVANSIDIHKRTPESVYLVNIGRCCLSCVLASCVKWRNCLFLYTYSTVPADPYRPTHQTNTLPCDIRPSIHTSIPCSNNNIIIGSTGPRRGGSKGHRSVPDFLISDWLLLAEEFYEISTIKHLSMYMYY